MFLKRIKSLLPKKLDERVALNHPVSQHSFRFRGSDKLQIFRFSKISKIVLGLSLLFYFSGYQPTLAIPPIKQSIAHAEFAQEQIIQNSSFKDSFILPHPGYLTSIFSSWHPGVDIATGLGMPIHPINSGKVIEVNLGFFGLGHSVVVEHEQGIKSIYGHMGRIFVQKDDLVTQNSILGEVGMTGHTSGPHTHLETTKNGQYFDPQFILPVLARWPESAGKAPTGKGQGSDKSKGEIYSTTAKPTPIPAPKLLIGIKAFQKEEKIKPLPLLLSPSVQP